MGGPAAIGGMSVSVQSTSYIDQDSDNSSLEILRSMFKMLEESGVDLPEALGSDINNLLDDPQAFYQRLVGDLDPVSLGNFNAIMGNVELDQLDPAATAETLTAIANGALEPGSPDYNRVMNQVEEFMGTFKANVGEGSDASRAAGELPENSLTKQVVGPLFDAADAQAAKVDSLLSTLKGYNERVKEGQDAIASGDAGRMRDYLLKYTDQDASELANKAPGQLKELIENDMDHVGGLGEIKQIELQQAMAMLQVIYSTAAGVVDAVKQATNRAANAIGN
jgi:hypothetical protein